MKSSQQTNAIRRRHYQKQKQIENDNLIAYWPLWEISNGTADDLITITRDGSYSGVTLNQSGIGDGKGAPLFDES